MVLPMWFFIFGNVSRSLLPWQQGVKNRIYDASEP